MPSRVKDRLSAARGSLFVGRTQELDLFRSALGDSEPPFLALYIFGPGGIGKTSLLREFERLCMDAHIGASYLDCRSIEPTPDAFLQAAQQILNLKPSESPLDYLSRLEELNVLLIDTYETLSPLDDWLRDTFLSQLPETTRIVLASREQPAPAWRMDAGWQNVLRTIPLRNLNPEESKEYLEKRRIPLEQHDAVLKFTHGHPLALSLCADTFDQRGSFQLEPEATRSVVETLVDQFLRKVPGPAHRTGVEACALIRVTNEPILAAMLDMEDVYELFQWLRELSFVESRPGGLFPHDLAREVIVADLRWRNPDWYAELHRRARVYYTRRLGETTGLEQQRALLDLVYLHRDNPVIQPFFEWQASGSLLPDVVREADLPVLIKMVRRFEGEESAEIAHFWLTHTVGGSLVLRSADGEPAGFLIAVSLESTGPDERGRDPAIQQAWSYLQRQAPLRSGERATHFRFWMSDEVYQAVSPVQSLIFIHIVRHYLTTPGLAVTFFPCADPEFWTPMCNYANLIRSPAADFQVGGKNYAVFTHDWRAEPPNLWLEILAEREIATTPEPVGPVHPPAFALVVLSEPDFQDAVRAALQGLKSPGLLPANPLLRSRLVAREAGRTASQEQRIEILKSLLHAAADEMQQSPRGLKFYRALYHTFFQPAPTQERAAEVLDLPFSTYRRHLKAGVDHITETLWKKEISGDN